MQKEEYWQKKYNDQVKIIYQNPRDKEGSKMMTSNNKSLLPSSSKASGPKLTEQEVQNLKDQIE